MALARSALEAPRAIREQMIRSIVTEGSPASILATRDWLEAIILANWTCVRGFRRRITLSCLANSSFISMYLSSSRWHRAGVRQAQLLATLELPKQHACLNARLRRKRRRSDFTVEPDRWFVLTGYGKKICRIRHNVVTPMASLHQYGKPCSAVAAGGVRNSTTARFASEALVQASASGDGQQVEADGDQHQAGQTLGPDPRPGRGQPLDERGGGGS